MFFKKYKDYNFEGKQWISCTVCHVIFQPVSRADREVIARLRNCVLALAEHKMLLFDTSILYTYEASLKFPVSGPYGFYVNSSEFIKIFEGRIETF